MTASFLLSECLEKIFSNFLVENPSSNTRTYTSTKDLYSCTLVSRHWCRISTPFLYAYPFHHFRHLAYPNIYPDNSNVTYISYFKLIRTLLGCIPKTEIEQIILLNTTNKRKLINFFNEEIFTSTDILATFHYITFIRGLIFDKVLFNQYELFHYQKMWLPSYIPIDNTTESQFSKISVPITNHLVKSLCKHCNNLTTLEFLFTIQYNELFNDMFEKLTNEDCNGKSKLSDLKELYYINRNEEFRFSPKDLYSSLSDTVSNLNLLYNKRINSIEDATSLSQFISSQKKLQHVILSERVMRLFSNNIDDYYNIVFNSLSTQKENLQILEFKNLSFTEISEKALNSLCLLKNVRKLKLYKCKGINNHLCHWGENLTKLEVFELVADYFITVSESFLIQLIQSSSNTLIKLIINYGRSSNQVCQLFQPISRYLNSLTHLVLPKIYPSELISIFKSCSQLFYLSVILLSNRLQLENFKNLGKFIPKNLQKIRFEEMDYLMFNSNELKCFLEECVNGGSKLKYLEISGECYVSSKYFDFAEQFGVILIKV
ncbi:hypothetical protein C1645_872927 [Glomus cerebriforme]|uniref:Uncharacterized protein n=1 Tax=Glomus cerebriforme TaxID=658196 RepID=A0A397TJW8_9GLOM|nr:hypothetical protein C1645_872927 [Glomus cerebriforme]